MEGEETERDDENENYGKGEKRIRKNEGDGRSGEKWRE